LPKLARLQLQGHTVFHALSLLRAPSLHHVELTAYPSEDPQHWALLHPAARFPSLVTLDCQTEDHDMYRIAQTIRGHPKLRNVNWEIPAQFISDSLGVLCHLARQGSCPFRHQLDRFSITTTNTSLGETGELSFSKIAQELEKLVILWDTTRAESRPDFKLGLDEGLVRAWHEIARIVQEHCDVLFVHQPEHSTPEVGGQN